MAVSDSFLNEALNVETLIREKLSVCASISGLSYDLKANPGWLADEIVLQLTTQFAKKYFSPVFKTVKTPRTTWQHFKHQYASKWFKQRFPVQYDAHKFQVQGPTFLCPHFPWNDTREHMQWVTLTPELTPYGLAKLEGNL